VSQQIIEIVLTGGPAAGKSSALAHLSQRVADHGRQALVCPEVATMLHTSGVDIAALAADPAKFGNLQTRILRLQRALRHEYRELAASSGVPTVIFYDRGECDVASYTGPAMWQALLAEQQLTLHDVRDSHDAVLHMVSSAIGAPEAYTLANNAARWESVEEAANADRRTLAAWIGHPHLHIIDNTSTFPEKIERTWQVVAHVCGLPEPREIERKFLLAGPPDLTLPQLADAVTVEIEQHYLLSSEPEREIRVRRRSQGLSATHFRTEKVPVSASERQETEQIISAVAYRHALAEADPARASIRKRRMCFAFGSGYFELDMFEGAHAGLCLLEVELTHPDEDVLLPPFLDIEREVTNERQFSNSQLALTA
jgi:CYTH domain-containing protein/predicted ATPase